MVCAVKPLVSSVIFPADILYDRQSKSMGEQGIVRFLFGSLMVKNLFRILGIMKIDGQTFSGKFCGQTDKRFLAAGGLPVRLRLQARIASRCKLVDPCQGRYLWSEQIGRASCRERV